MLDGYGHRRLIRGARFRREFVDARRDNRAELRLQCHKFGHIGFHSLIGNYKKPEDLPLIIFQLPVAKEPGAKRGQGRTDWNANIVKILLKLVKEALIAVRKIGGDARMNR